MKNLQKRKLIKLFNRPNTTLIISSYPERKTKYSHKTDALGGFSKNTVEGIKTYLNKANQNQKFIVLALTIGPKKEIYKENGVLVWRVFTRNQPLSYFNLWRAIHQFDQVKNVLIEFEFGSFGNTATTTLFPFTLLYLRMLRKNITLVLHQVILNLESLCDHIGWKKTRIKIKIYNLGTKIFLYELSFLSQKIVVLEKALKTRLSQMVGMKKKIIVIPHGVDQKIKTISSKEAKKKLGFKKNEPILLYFGYLTWYKGVDLLIETFVKNQIKINSRPIYLIIAGGESLTQKEKPHYQKFVQKVYDLASKSSFVTITGFVKEKDIPLYFAAADLVVFPYRTFMSSSGPLSLCLSFSKPFILSQPLAKYFSSPDFITSLHQGGLKKEDILFPLQESLMIKKIKTAFKNKEKLANFSAILAQKRNFETLAPKYIKTIKRSQLKTAIWPSKLIKQFLRYA